MNGESIRDDIWELVEKDFGEGNFDSVVSTALRHVESTIQKMSANNAIGNGLIDATFGSSIVISSKSQDRESLKNLFKGSIGFFKGSRSHGPAPIVPVGGPVQCLRVLTLASALMDILDYDESRRPSIASFRQTGESVEFQCNNIGPSTACTVDNNGVRVISRRPGLLEIDSSDLAVGQHNAVLTDAGIVSVHFEFEVIPERPSNWHRVIQVDVSLYKDEKGLSRRPEIGVILESYEGGKFVRRCFPTTQRYEAGDYATWEWPMNSGSLGETWIKDPSGEVVQAWLGASFFGGQVIKAQFPPRTVGLRLFPEHQVQLGIGELIPFMLEEHITDGVGQWDSLSNDGKSVTSSDEKVVFVDQSKRVLRAKGVGQTTIQAQPGKHFAQSTIDVIALKSGSVLKFLGGIKHAAGVACSDKIGLLVTNQTSTIHQVTLDGKYQKFTEVGTSYLEIGGLDNIAIDSNATVYVRSMGSFRCVLAIDSRNPGRLQEIKLEDDRSPIAHCVCGTTLFITDHKGRVWEYEEGKLRTFCDVVTQPDSSFTLTHIAADENYIWVLDNRTGFYVINRASGQVDARKHKGSGNQFSSILAMDGRLLLSDFHGGRIFSYETGELVQIASGLDNPNSIAKGIGDTILVANFGTEGVARVVI